MKELAKNLMYSILLGEARRWIEEETMSKRREGCMDTHTKGFNFLETAAVEGGEM